ncbi:MAG: tungsten ABC transporter substrate-binding protein [Deltaproteobacteria bacterium]|nr:tungsten ABC transporter substrate-binding protein [Deltaproteobacteria bacterium]
MKKIGMLVAVLSLLLPTLVAAQDKVLKMSTTTSTQSSGLLDVLLPEFKKDTGIEVKVMAKGTGAAIRDGMDGNVDVIFVHDPAREEKFVADGYGTKRYYVMFNDFLLIGPASDPAGAKGKDAAVAMKKIARSEAVFVSRGDDSGTHAKEQELWKDSGLELKEEDAVFKAKNKEVTFKAVHPAAMKGFMSIGQGMGKTLVFAEEKQGYTITDRGTYVQYKYGRQEGLDLEPICEGDKRLFNPYGVIPVNPAKFSHVRFDLADAFAKWLVSERGQAVIANYKLLGQQLFFPDAK